LPATLLIGFILPCPSVTTFFRSASLRLCTSGEPSSFISTFIILAMFGFGAPSAPWQDLQRLVIDSLSSGRVAGRKSQAGRGQ